MSEQPALSGPNLTVRRTFAAARSKIFQAWTDPQALEVWFKPFGLSIRVDQFDLKVGGSFRFEVQPAGQLSVTGTYLEIVEPRKLVFTWTSPMTGHQETTVTVQFEERANGTEVILTHSGLMGEEMFGKHRQGWQTALDELDWRLNLS